MTIFKFPNSSRFSMEPCPDDFNTILRQTESRLKVQHKCNTKNKRSHRDIKLSFQRFLSTVVLLLQKDSYIIYNIYHMCWNLKWFYFLIPLNFGSQKLWCVSLMTHLDLSNQNVCDAPQHSNKVKNVPCLLQIVLQT